MDALERLYQLIDKNPNITNEEMAEVLREEGLAKSEHGVMKFLELVGLEDDIEKR